MIKYIIKFLFLAILLTSCKEQDNRTIIEITNKNTHTIKEVQIVYGTETEYKHHDIGVISTNRSELVHLDMNLNGQDGIYNLQYTINDAVKNKSFGYYSNAVFDDKHYHITIKKDTVMIVYDIME